MKVARLARTRARRRGAAVFAHVHEVARSIERDWLFDLDARPLPFDDTRVDGSCAILIGREVRVCSRREHVRWIAATLRDDSLRRVGDDTVDGVRVSTVFLGLDHSFMLGAPPQWFETMVFGGQLDELQQRYTTWAQAEAGHALLVQMLQLVDVADIGRDAIEETLRKIARDEP